MPPLSNDDRSALLSGAGIAAGGDGFDLGQMEGLAAARGWTLSVTPATTHHGRPGRWRALVFVPTPESAYRGSALMGSRGTGRTEAAALAKALATALGRER